MTQFLSNAWGDLMWVGQGPQCSGGGTQRWTTRDNKTEVRERTRFPLAGSAALCDCSLQESPSHRWAQQYAGSLCRQPIFQGEQDMFCLQSNNASLDVGRTQQTYSVRTEKQAEWRQVTTKCCRWHGGGPEELRSIPQRNWSWVLHLSPLNLHPLRAYKHRGLRCRACHQVSWVGSPFPPFPHWTTSLWLIS